MDSSVISDNLNFVEHPDFELHENIQILDVLTKLGFWPCWPWKWPWGSIMTLNLKYVAFVPYVSLFSVMSNCCFCHFWQLSWNYYTCIAADKNYEHIHEKVSSRKQCTINLGCLVFFFSKFLVNSGLGRLRYNKVICIFFLRYCILIDFLWE